jgi:protein tyrosine phosphatase (PTP) superfamily phosphohydrolase (DUF442 family)
MTSTPRSRRLTASSLGLVAAFSLACQARESVVVRSVEDSAPRTSAAQEAFVPPPLDLVGTAYELAGTVSLPAVPPGNYPGLHNVYRLSDRIISGSEPADDEALTQLAAWGVRTVISVDGKVPDLEGARRAGLDYVHIPIRYSGIDDDQIAQIAKSFRELEGPFYVHCYHGKHRGPAAAAIGRVALDGLTRDRAIAEMRQWCSTASKYEGLYSSVAVSEIPSAMQTAAYDFDFAPAKTFGGFRDVMVEMTRVWDEVKLVRKNHWAASAEHPDVDPLQSATQLHQLFLRCHEHDTDGADDSEFQQMLAEGTLGMADMVRLLTDCRTEGAAADDLHQGLEVAYDAVSESCLSCHSAYRN